MLRFLGQKTPRRILLGGLPTIALLTSMAAAAATCVVIVIGSQCPEGAQACLGPAAVGQPNVDVPESSPSPSRTPRATPETVPPVTPSVTPPKATPSEPTPSVTPPKASPAARTPGPQLGADGQDPRAGEFVQEVELRRSAAGCQPLRDNEVLRDAAKSQALELWSRQGAAAHVDHKGATAQDRATKLGYNGRVIEVVASGTKRVDQVVGAFDWVMTDSDLLDCTYKSSGAAVVDGFWVLVLGSV